MESMKAISQEIDGLQMMGLTPEEEQYLAALNICYDILARTTLIRSQVVEINDQIFTESDKPELHQVYGISSSPLADYIISTIPVADNQQEEDEKWQDFYESLE